MDFNQIARELIPLLGGKENIASAAHCATRLRLVLVDDALADQQAIGKVDGVTRERIRQIESKTMSKLRHPSRSQILRDYLE